LKNNTSYGPVGISNEAIKMVAKLQPSFLLQIYNQCINQGVFPKAWKHARLVLLKKGNKPVNEPSSYHPLCLLDCVGKLFEKILDNCLRNHLETDSENGLATQQYSFRKVRSIADAIEFVCKTVEDSSKSHKVSPLTSSIGQKYYKR